MKFHVIEKDGHRREVSPLEYLEAPVCKRAKFMEALRELRAEREARRIIRIEEELEKNCAAALKLKGTD